MPTHPPANVFARVVHQQHQPGGHPLATPVNKNKQNPTTKVVFPSLPNLYSQPLSSPHTWFSLPGWAAGAPVTHQDQGLGALRRLAPGCLGSPRKPSVPHRVQLRRSDQLTAQVCGFAQVQSNPLWLTSGRISKGGVTTALKINRAPLSLSPNPKQPTLAHTSPTPSKNPHPPSLLHQLRPQIRMRNPHQLPRARPTCRATGPRRIR